MKTAHHLLRIASLFAIVGILLATTADAQRSRSDAPGTVSDIEWSDDGKSLSFTTEGRRYRFDLETLSREEVEEPKETDERGEGRRRPPGERLRGGGSDNGTGKYVGRPTRGRQYVRVDSPDGAWEAHYRDWNVVLQNKESGESIPVTTDGDELVHYGTASWVYGEELDELRAMWWTPDSRKLIFYKFDDSKVEPFHLVTGWSEVQTQHYPEYYPKAGQANPSAELLVYDLATKETKKIQAGGGSEEYLFHLRASPDGSVMMVNWTDRLQHDLKVLALDPDTGACRVVVQEHQDTWQTNRPRMRFLEDGSRFLWPTDEPGYTRYELRDLDGTLHCTVTSGDFQTERLQLVDEEDGLVGFTAYSSAENPYYVQYHLVGLDGEGQRRVTTLDRHHSGFSLSPDRKWLVARYEETDTPPCTALYGTDGKLVATLAESDPADAAHLAEMFTFESDDGEFDIYGILYKPKGFDPDKSYPLLNVLYGGPGSREISARYVSTERSECRRGYLVVKVNNRGTGGRGKAFLGAVYERLGDVDIQDHADAVRLLAQRPYVDGERVGIVGHSYGGYMAAMGVFKHPDVYTAAVVGSGLTDWRNYDTIYTERYMSTPQLNEKGYDVGRAMTYVDGFKGHVLILHGMIDDNVHPTNAFQLIAAMDAAGKSYEARFWPDAGHGMPGQSAAQWEFFNRVLRPEAP